MCAHLHTIHLHVVVLDAEPFIQHFQMRKRVSNFRGKRKLRGPLDVKILFHRHAQTLAEVQTPQAEPRASSYVTDHPRRPSGLS